MTRHVLIATLIAALWAAPAVAGDDDDSGCKLRMDTVTSHWRIGDVDLFNTETAFASFELHLENEGDAPCSLRLVTDTQGAPFGLTSGGGRRFGYAIYDHETGADLTPRNGRSPGQARPAIQVPARGQTIARLDVAVPNTFTTDGVYTQQLQFEAEGDRDSQARRTVTLAVDVGSSASMALSGHFTRAGSNADIDLGEIEPGPLHTPLILHVRSSRAYRIDSSSENGGFLKLPGTVWEIPYRMSIDGKSLESDGGAYFSTPGNGRRVDNLKLGFAVTSVGNVAAGRYSDVVTLSIAVD